MVFVIQGYMYVRFFLEGFSVMNIAQAPAIELVLQTKVCSTSYVCAMG